MVIYCTTNLVNSHKYIGKDSKNDPNYFGSGKIIQRAIKKYGKENFKKQILEYCTSLENLNEAEKYWIDYFGACNSSLFYNIAEGGLGGDLEKGLSEEERLLNRERRKITHSKTVTTEEYKKQASLRGKEVYMKNPDKNAKLRKPVLCYNLKGELVQRYNSISQASEKLDIGFTNIIYSINKGCRGQVKGFMFKYSGEIIKSKIEPYKRFSSKGVATKANLRCAERKEKRVYQYDLNGNLIQIHKSLHIASINMKTHITTIWRVLKGELKTCKKNKLSYNKI